MTNELLARIGLLEEDNKILRENYEQAIKLLKENKQLKEKIEWYEKENRHNQEIIIKNVKVLDEIREVIIELRNIIYNPDYENFGLSREQYKDRFIHIFEILDKVKE